MINLAELKELVDAAVEEVGGIENAECCDLYTETVAWPNVKKAEVEIFKYGDADRAYINIETE